MKTEIVSVEVYTASVDEVILLCVGRSVVPGGKTITSIEEKPNGDILFYHGVDVIYKLRGGSYGIAYREV